MFARARRLALSTVVLIVLVLAMSVAPAHALAPTTGATPTSGKAWPRGATLRVYGNVGAAFDKSLQAAIDQYATTGARIRLVRTTNRSRAHIVIMRHEAQREFARSSQGRPARGPGTIRIRLRHLISEQRPYAAAYLLTHELGHVLGLTHQPRFVCTVMSEYTFAGRCESVDQRATPLSPGVWNCRILQVTDHRALVRLYGGRAAPARPAACSDATGRPIQQLAPPANVTVSASAAPGEHAIVSWTATPSTTRVQILRHTSACSAIGDEDVTEELLTGTSDLETGTPDAFIDGALGTLVDREPVVDYDQQPVPAGPLCYELRSYSTIDGARADTVFVEHAYVPRG